MAHFGLAPVPFRESLHLPKVIRVGDPALFPRGQRILQGQQSGQVVHDEIRIPPELVAFIEVIRPAVGQHVPGHAGDQGDGHKPDEPEQRLATRDDEITQAIEEDRLPETTGPGPQRNDRKQRGAAASGHRRT